MIPDTILSVGGWSCWGHRRLETILARLPSNFLSLHIAIQSPRGNLAPRCQVAKSSKDAVGSALRLGACVLTVLTWVALGWCIAVLTQGWVWAGFAHIFD